MNSFLSALGTKLAEKWLASLVLPGLLFVGCGLAAILLSPDRPFDAKEVVIRATDTSERISRTSVTAVVLSVIALALAATASALTAQGAGFLARHVWQGKWPRSLARQLTKWRRNRWNDADETLAVAIHEGLADADARDDLAWARNRIALSYPRRPTWIGDRLLGADIRVWHSYGLDLAAVWPRLWILMNEVARGEITAAHGAYIKAATLAGWGMLYTLLGLLWWPATPVGAGVLVLAWSRARAAAALLADAIEASVDLNARALAIQLGALADGDNFTRQCGEHVTQLLRKGT
ncbi:hypothetical protein [Streptomyces olivaceiscleroticus]|uniref:Vegetative cell wall protein gp1 n=1 Tax=Streptomyces olivaceiscleroticus TaxID=68245 RepID=A0ABP3JFR6_9ACTN